MEEEIYGIDKDQDQAHPRAIELVPEDFFWSCIDELAPFGSDEGEIDAINKPIIQLAIQRQKIWTELSDWEHGEEYLNNLQVLERVLEVA